MMCFIFRPLPPLPDLEISEESVTKAAETLQVWMNYPLLVAREIALGGNFKLFCEVRTSSLILRKYPC